MSADAPDPDDEQTSFVDLEAEPERVDENANVAVRQVSRLRERVDDLEDQLRAIKADMETEKLRELGLDRDPGRLDRDD